jgi:hypothetical protein
MRRQITKDANGGDGDHRAHVRPPGRVDAGKGTMVALKHDVPLPRTRAFTIEEDTEGDPLVLLRAAALERYRVCALDLYGRMAAAGRARGPLPRDLSCPALVVGRAGGALVTVEAIVPCENSRHPGDVIAEEYQGVHADPTRGYLVDPRDVLKVSRWARAIGCDVIGSIHTHSDLWMRPEYTYIEMVSDLIAQGLCLSEQPTGFDRDLFRRTGWPLNLIFYLRAEGGRLRGEISAWCPKVGDDQGEYAQAPVVVDRAAVRLP